MNKRNNGRLRNGSAIKRWEALIDEIDGEQPPADPSPDLIVWSRSDGRTLLGARCGKCNGEGDFVKESTDRILCKHCFGRGWFGINPRMPVSADQGSIAKIAMLAVRYASGLPLWNPRDGASHRSYEPPIDLSDGQERKSARRRRSRRKGPDGSRGSQKTVRA